MEHTRECVVDGQLKCAGKREFTKRGVRFAQITLKRSSGYSVKFTVPAADAAAVELGGYYKIAILPDGAPEAPEPPKLNPGDHVLHSWKWAGLQLWRPAVLVSFTQGGSAIVRDWRHGVREQIVKVASLTPATDPFPGVDDFTAMLPGDIVLWRDKYVAIEGLVSSGRAVVNYLIVEEGLPVHETATKLVPLAELVPTGASLIQKPISADPKPAEVHS